MLKIWGRISSINVRKVVLATQWMGLPFERIDAGHEFGVVRTAPYLARNPNALVPVLEDGDFVLWESNVIVRYLCARHSLGDLYPEALPARFDAERWMDWQQTALNPAGRDAFVQHFRTPLEQRDHSLIERSAAATEPLLDLLDAHLAVRPFVAGNAMTMADFPLACEIHRWRAVPVPHPTRPHLDRWYDAIRRAPAASGVLDVSLS